MAWDRPDILGPTRGFAGWPIQWSHAKCCGPTLVATATTFGLGAEIQTLTGLLIFSFLSEYRIRSLLLRVQMVSWQNEQRYKWEEQ